MADPQRGKVRILVIDDDESIRELVKLHLSKGGYETILAEDAVVAGHIVVDRAPDLIIADVKMPYMNGYDFVAALKTDPTTRDIPVVFLTTSDDVAERSRQLGAAAYLTKPVSAARLLEVVGLFAAQ